MFHIDFDIDSVLVLVSIAPVIVKQKSQKYYRSRKASLITLNALSKALQGSTMAPWGPLATIADPKPALHWSRIQEGMEKFWPIYQNKIKLDGEIITGYEIPYRLRYRIFADTFDPKCQPLSKIIPIMKG